MSKKLGIICMTFVLSGGSTYLYLMGGISGAENNNPQKSNHAKDYDSEQNNERNTDPCSRYLQSVVPALNPYQQNQIDLHQSTFRLVFSPRDRIAQITNLN
mgnify:CR=1 FL=1